MYAKAFDKHVEILECICLRLHIVIYYNTNIPIISDIYFKQYVNLLLGVYRDSLIFLLVRVEPITDS